MALVDDLNQPVEDREISRRRALMLLGGGALTAAGLGTAITGVKYLRPNVLFEPATKFTVGRAADVAVGQVLDLPARKLFLVRSEAGFYAMSAVCTHLGCMVKHQAQANAKEAFFCPCHGSRYDKEGNVLGGPAPRPLDQVELVIDGGQLVVDVSRPVPHRTVTKA